MQKPIIFKSREEAPGNAIFVDAFSGSLEELFFIEHPNLKKQMPEAKAPLEECLKNYAVAPIWIYFPWKNTLVKSLPEDLYFKLRTSRNRNIIKEDEQKKYRDIIVGIAGLSVGSGVVSALVITGGPKIMKIADFDVLEVTNLNRIRASLLDVGSNKTEIASRQVWELDPFAELFLYDQGLSPANLEEFVLGGENSPRLDTFVDEMDSLDLKVRSRLICRKNKIPVLMATDNGDSIILDVERFDLEPDRQIFHGLVGDMREDDLKNLDFKKWLELATKIVGPTYLTERMQDSLLEMGKSVAAVPQLGSTAAVAGGAISFVARRIANGESMPSGRYGVGFEEKLISGYLDPEAVMAREAETKDFISKFGKK